MALFKRKAVLIEAVQFKSLQSIDELKEFMGDSFINWGIDKVGWIEIGTLEDGENDHQVRHIASVGDFIIKGVEEEFYACKPDIFKKIYDEYYDYK